MNISFSKKLLFVFAYFLSPEVFAGIFNVLPTDKSLEYLGIIFGGSVGAITLGGDANPLLSRMFERFNFIIVTVGVSILSYIGIAAAINTAREGEAMGKKFSLWVPLRAMLGMLLMVPSPGTGYSVVQMTVMWVVLNGIGAANQVWGIVLDQLASGLKAAGKIEVPISNQDIGPTVEAVLKASTCMQFLNNTPGIPLVQEFGRVKPIVRYKPFVPPLASADKISETATVSVGIEGTPDPANESLCGSFTVSTVIIKGDKNNAFNKSSLDTRLAIKINGLMAMFSVLEPASAVLRVSYSTDPPEPELGYVQQAINGYKAQLVNLIMGVKNQPGPSIGGLSVQGSNAIIDTGTALASAGNAVKQAWEAPPENVPIASEQVAAFKRLGWIHAGSYYYSMSKSADKVDLDASSKILPDLIPNSAPTIIPLFSDPANATTPPIGWIGAKQLYTVLNSYNNRVAFIQAESRAGYFYLADQVTSLNSLPALGSGNVSSGNKFIDKIVGGISDNIRRPIIEKFQSGFTGQKEDPLIGIGKFGWELMLAGELSIFYSMIVAFGISTLASPASCMNPAAYSVNQLLLQVFIVVFTFLVLMWTIGATLGVYIPLIPYIIFTGTAVGWLLAVIEAIVAAPLIALAMVQPGGEELGALKTPLMILANLFLRPTLMIFGFVIAASFLRAILTMINFGFSRAVEESVIPTLFGIVPVLGIYAGFVIAMINEAFSLIYDLPNKVIRYMGGKEESFSPGKLTEGAEKGGKQGGEAAAGAMKAAGSGVQGKLKTKMEEGKKMHEDQNAPK